MRTPPKFGCRAGCCERGRSTIYQQATQRGPTMPPVGTTRRPRPLPASRRSSRRASESAVGRSASDAQTGAPAGALPLVTTLLPGHEDPHAPRLGGPVRARMPPQAVPPGDGANGRCTTCRVRHGRSGSANHRHEAGWKNFSKTVDNREQQVYSAFRLLTRSIRALVRHNESPTRKARATTHGKAATHIQSAHQRRPHRRPGVGLPVWFS